ncbi:hypothetical protein FPV58_06630 [Mycolicibacterium porcinum]|uniref:hypothetical protein n=1 Tax=Mycolicibacterium porcinum TaxID=39693 RepID=UPI00119367E5|nr:hypothetical protein [Mycolicibacterium porcinum]TVY05099.1 hypothetical protein FPV58_06630 [Mycolicibacterium porcinum]
MSVTLRSPLAAGVALVGASAIALTPISPIPADLPAPAIHSATVELTTFQNPIALWADVLGATGSNVAGLAGQWLEDPAPMLTQIIANQIHSLGALAQAGNSFATGMANAFSLDNPSGVPAILQKAVEQIAAGQFEDGFITALSSVVFLGLPVIMAASQAWPALSQPFKNLGNLVDGSLFPVLMGVGLGMIAPFEPLLREAGTRLEVAVSAIKDMDPVTLASTVINAPAALTGAFLNGYMDPEFNYLYPGLLSAPPNASGAAAGILNTFSQLADLIKTPGTDRHDLGGALANLIGGIFGGAQANRSAVQETTDDQVVVDGPSAVNALPSATAKAITVNLTTDAGVKATVTEAPAERVVAEKAIETDAQTTVSDAATKTEPASTETNENTTVSDDDGATVTEKTDTTAEATSTSSTRVTAKVPSTKLAEKVRGDIKKSADSVGKNANSTVAKIRDGLNKSITKPAKPNKKADSSAGNGSSDPGPGKGSE